jgi:hypothetical protein
VEFFLAIPPAIPSHAFMFTHSTTTLLLAGLLATAPGLLFADGPPKPVPPDSTVALEGLQDLPSEWPATSVSDLNIPFEIRNASGTVILSGNVQDRVSKSHETGTLIFSPIVRDLEAPGGSTARILSIRATGYAGATITAEYYAPTDNATPDSVSRSAGNGDELELHFDSTPVTPPDSSQFVKFLTNATGYSKAGRITITAEESPGGPQFTAVLENTVAPVLFAPDTVPIVSFTRNDDSFTLRFLNEANSWYEIQVAPSPNGPWTKKSRKYCRSAPTEVTIKPTSPRPAMEFYHVLKSPSP